VLPVRSQVERRHAILAAALDLAAEGGYDAVQVRDIARRAGVTVRTIYQHFPSKDHILQESWALWAEGLDEFVLENLEGQTPAQLATEVLCRLTLFAARQPRVAEAVMRSSVRHDEVIAPVVDLQRRAINGALESVLSPWMEPTKVPRVANVLIMTWSGLFRTWLFHGGTLEETCAAIADAAHLLLDDLDDARRPLRLVRSLD
jgi:AcrR family transcriptional regulator